MFPLKKPLSQFTPRIRKELKQLLHQTDSPGYEQIHEKLQQLINLPDDRALISRSVQIKSCLKRAHDRDAEYFERLIYMAKCFYHSISNEIRDYTQRKITQSSTDPRLEAAYCDTVDEEEKKLIRARIVQISNMIVKYRSFVEYVRANYYQDKKVTLLEGLQEGYIFGAIITFKPNVQVPSVFRRKLCDVLIDGYRAETSHYGNCSEMADLNFIQAARLEMKYAASLSYGICKITDTIPDGQIIGAGDHVFSVCGEDAANLFRSDIKYKPSRKASSAGYIVDSTIHGCSSSSVFPVDQMHKLTTRVVVSIKDNDDEFIMGIPAPLFFHGRPISQPAPQLSSEECHKYVQSIQILRYSRTDDGSPAETLVEKIMDDKSASKPEDENLFLTDMNYVFDLVKAVLEEDIPTIREHLSWHRVCINNIRFQGKTLLHIAAEAGKGEVTLFLIQSSAISVDVLDEKQCTPLFLAAEAGNVDIVKMLVSEASANVNIACNNVTPLEIAAKNDHIDIVRILLFYGALPPKRSYDIKRIFNCHSAPNSEAIKLLLLASSYYYSKLNTANSYSHRRFSFFNKKSFPIAYGIANRLVEELISSGLKLELEGARDAQDIFLSQKSKFCSR